MKNYEKYADEIKGYKGLDFCGDVVFPHVLKSEDCGDITCNRCYMLQMIWLMEDYEEPEVDWSKVEVDTPVLVREYEHENWVRRYFAKYEGGKVYVWNNGRTSWTEKFMTPWKFAKLAENEETK